MCTAKGHSSVPAASVAWDNAPLSTIHPTSRRRLKPAPNLARIPSRKSVPDSPLRGPISPPIVRHAAYPLARPEVELILPFPGSNSFGLPRLDRQADRVGAHHGPAVGRLGHLDLIA